MVKNAWKQLVRILVKNGIRLLVPARVPVVKMKPVAVVLAFLPYVRIVLVLMTQHVLANPVRIVGVVQRDQSVVRSVRVKQIAPLMEVKFWLPNLMVAMNVNYLVRKDMSGVAGRVFQMYAMIVKLLTRKYANVSIIAGLMSNVVVVNVFLIIAENVKYLIQKPVLVSISVQKKVVIRIVVTERVLRIIVPAIRLIRSVISVLSMMWHVIQINVLSVIL